MKKIFRKFWLLVSQEWLKEYSLNLECGFPKVDDTLHCAVGDFTLFTSCSLFQLQYNSIFYDSINILIANSNFYDTNPFFLLLNTKWYKKQYVNMIKT